VLGLLVLPSSSTVLQIEGHAIQSILERNHERHEGESENASQAGEQEAGEGLDTAPPNTTIQLFFSISWTCPNALANGTVETP
jgi:hypothetical protein